MKTCIDCKITKPIEEFYKHKTILKISGKPRYETRCKYCYMKRYSPNWGKPNTGRLKKGHTPWNKKKYSKQSLEYKEWRKMVFERDNYKCRKCFSTKNLNAHHVKAWKNYPNLRFDINNGLTLCSTCHGKTHCNILKNGLPWIAGRRMGIEFRKKLSDAHKGQVAWNKGKPMREETKKKLINCGAFFKKGHVPWIKEHGHDEISREKMRKAHKGKVLSEEIKRKISESNKKTYALKISQT